MNLLTRGKITSNTVTLNAREHVLLRKINRVIVPFLVLAMFFNQIDKMTLNLAAMLGIYQDTNITRDEFGLVGSLFFAGQLIFTPVVIYCLQRFPISKTYGAASLFWGATLIGTSFASNFLQLAVCRTLLGAFEAFTIPLCSLAIKTYYRRSEQGKYLAIMYIGLCIGLTCGSLLTFGIAHLLCLHIWVRCMLLYGSATVIFSAYVFIFLPDTPYSKLFSLTSDEKSIVADRLADNNVSYNAGIQWDHIWEALKEPRYYALVAISFLCNIPNGCINVFSSQLIRDLGFSKLNSVLLNIPRSVYETISYFIYMCATSKIHWCHNHTAYTTGLLTIIPTIGVLLLRAIPVYKAPIVRLLGLCITPTTYTTLGIQILISSNVSGKTKMVFYTVTITAFNVLGHFAGPLIMFERESPSYPTALTIYILADVVSIILLFYVGWSLIRQNHHRQPNIDFNNNIQCSEDLTDTQQQNFVYRP
ncbi:major facilitator superfamily domain-containing protein [Fennellomyces sp. T-0311]|nr:major facilitator superfamily domain-containing protein [Fennellomyces sp. T-0311]